MIYNILRRADLNTINNSSGANMPGGIVTCFAEHYKFFDRSVNKYAIIEVDEAYLKHITAQIKPSAIVVTNIFQDQVDRYGDVLVTLNYIADAIKNAPESTLIINADQPILRDLPIPNRCIYYGCNAPAHDEKTETPSITPDFAVGENVSLSLNKSTIEINKQKLSIGIPGFYNIYNALCAYAVSSYLGIPHEIIAASLAEQTSKFGRFEVMSVEQSELVMLLIKNAAGANQCIDTVALDDGNMSFLIMLNDNAGDGRDISWINDTNFEKLTELNYSNVIAGGTRAEDLAARLSAAGLKNIETCGSFDEIITLVAAEKKRVYALVSYTAMVTFRKYLASKGYAENVW
jgi:UDP-N-acetylmuramyl tripeptide synthase